jgi:hypothetical protein
MTARTIDSKNQQGNALVLTTMILLALSSVGLLAVQQSKTDLNAAGNLVKAMQLEMAAEAGAYHSMELLRDRCSTILKQIDREMTNADRVATSNPYAYAYTAAYSTADPNPTSRETDFLPRRVAATPSSDGTLHLPVINPGAPFTEKLRQQQALAFDVRADHIREEKVPGQGLENGICYHTFDLTTRAAIPGLLSEPAYVSLQNNAMLTRLRITVGPTQCGLSQ